MTLIQQTTVEHVVVRFAGDSGDGIQLLGSEFTLATALAKNDLGTFPDYPAEIRAPAGTMAGVSGFQIHFGSEEVYTPGDMCDVLVVMNAAALRKSLPYLRPGGMILANEDGFDNKNLRLSGYAEGAEPLVEATDKGFIVITLPLTKLTKESIKDMGLGTKDAERSKNMFMLGLLYWLYDRPLHATEDVLRRKFVSQPLVRDANLRALAGGYAFGETAELFPTRYKIGEAPMPKGIYRGITGNLATAYGLVAASKKANLPLFYGSYPITPASDILHELARLKHFGVTTFQAEDEIAAVCASIGASYGGQLGVTASSGPGIDLKAEAIGLAVMLELPLVVIDVQRAGPSTGMPTKTEQADLLLALYGRHGESPVPILAPASPADAFTMAFDAARLALEWMTPVFLLSDASLANGTEPWAFPSEENLPIITPPFFAKEGTEYQPYLRDDRGVRAWALPGSIGLEHRIGGLEKEEPSGNISYDGPNHERMVARRAAKIANIADAIPEAFLDSGEDSGSLLVIGWGSTYGAIKTACKNVRKGGHKVSHLQLRYLNPLPKGLENLASRFQNILLPEMNLGQLRGHLQGLWVRPIESFTKVQGLPFSIAEIEERIIHSLTHSN